jgi:large subunit ribosomal protein L9
MPATVGNLAQIEELKRQAEARVAEVLKEANELKAKLEATSAKLERSVGEESKMYGSVTAKDIEEAYKALGLTIDRRKVTIAEPIKSLGLFDVKVRLHHEVEANLRVEVVKAG